MSSDCRKGDIICCCIFALLVLIVTSSCDPIVKTTSSSSIAVNVAIEGDGHVVVVVVAMVWSPFCRASVMDLLDSY